MALERAVDKEVEVVLRIAAKAAVPSLHMSPLEPVTQTCEAPARWRP